jgi:hypothetical protein
MECGQKAPPAAKFCPGCGNAMSLTNDAGVKSKEEAHDDAPSKDLTLPEGSVTILGDSEETQTIQSVIASVPEGYEAQKIVRTPNSQFKGLTTKQIARKLAQINTSDGSKEA